MIRMLRTADRWTLPAETATLPTAVLTADARAELETAPGNAPIRLDGWSLWINHPGAEPALTSILCVEGMTVAALLPTRARELSELPARVALPLDELSSTIVEQVFKRPQMACSTFQREAALSLIAMRVADGIREELMAGQAVSDASSSFSGAEETGKHELPKGKRTELAEEIRGYFEAHLDETITLQALAEAFECSPSTLGSVFRQAGLPSPMRVLSEVRLKRARELLQQSRMTIGQVGEAVGYADLAAFTHFFRKHAGMSPREFRDSCRWLA